MLLLIQVPAHVCIQLIHSQQPIKHSQFTGRMEVLITIRLSPVCNHLQWKLFPSCSISSPYSHIFHILSVLGCCWTCSRRSSEQWTVVNPLDNQGACSAGAQVCADTLDTGNNIHAGGGRITVSDSFHEGMSSLTFTLPHTSTLTSFCLEGSVCGRFPVYNYSTGRRLQASL